MTVSTTTVTSAPEEREGGSQTEGFRSVETTGPGRAMNIQGEDEDVGEDVFRRAEEAATVEEEVGEPAIRSETETMEGEAGVGNMTGITMIDEDLMTGRDRACAELRILHVEIQMNVAGSTTRLQSLLVVHTHPDVTAGRLLLMAALIGIHRDLR